MSIRRKIALFIFVIFVVSFFVLNLSYSLIIDSYLKKLDLVYAQKELEILTNELESNLSFVDSIAKNEAYWDDLYNFVKGENPDFIKSNFGNTNQTLKDLGINIYLVLNNKGKTVFFRCNLSYEYCNNFLEEMQRFYNKEERLGFIKIKNKLFGVSLRNITPTNNFAVSAGKLIIAREIKPVQIINLLEGNTLNKKFEYTYNPLIKVTTGHILVNLYNTDFNFFGYEVFGKKITGDFSYLFSGFIKKTMSEKGKNVHMFLNLTILSIFVAVMGIVYVGINKLIVNPVRQLAEEIKNLSVEQSFSKKLDKNYGSKEIDLISREMSKLLKTIEMLISEINEKNELFKTIAENTPIGIYIFSEKFEYVNPALEKITGYTQEELTGKSISSFLSLSEVDEKMKQSIISAAERRLKGEIFRNEFQIKIKTKQGEEKDILVIANTVFLSEKPYGLGIAIDITETKKLERQLLEQAEKDSLTGLYNRFGFTKKIEEFLEIYSREKKKFFLLFIDLNKFKNINDSFGHQIGDVVLKQIGNRLRKNLRKVDVVARFGGDEFGILITTYSKFEDITQILKKVIHLIEEPVHINELTFNITASIGISVFPEDGKDVNTLLKRADIAMYRAKEKSRKENRSSFIFFSKDLEKKIKEKLEIERELRDVLKNRKEEIYILYQPIFNLKTMEISRLEALVRWNSSKFGSLPPAKFITIAEETGLIKDISNIVLDRVCQQIILWKDRGINPKVSVNISPVEFMEKDFTERILSRLKPECLEENISIEITENVLIENVAESREKIESLKKHGIKILLDDFGTGYSSLTYLKKFPISMLKIDREFIKDIPQDREDVEIVKTIVKLSEILQTETVAEGIENQIQLEILREIGCTYGQGFFLGKPAYPSEIEKMLTG